MGFFEDLKLVKNKRGYVVEYGKDSLLQIYPKAFTNLFKDYATKKFINAISEVSSITDVADDLKATTSKLEKLFTIEKRKFYNLPRIKRIEASSADYKHLIKAARLYQIYSESISMKQFLDAQVAGLKFINDGKGAFPKPSQLHTTNAEERVAQFISNIQDEKPVKVKEVKRMALSYYDKTTELRSNPKFEELYEKLVEKTATLQEAYFVHDCMIARKTYATKTVKDYIAAKKKET